MSEIDVHTEPIKELRRRLDIYMKEFHQEHGLINNRMTWYVMSQSFLAIAVASAGQKDNKLWWLVVVIPVVGLLVSFVTYRSVSAALEVQDILKKKKDKLINSFNINHNYNSEQLAIVIEPWGIRDEDVQKGGMLGPKFIPQVVIGFWVVVLLVSLLQIVLQIV